MPPRGLEKKRPSVDWGGVESEEETRKRAVGGGDLLKEPPRKKLAVDSSPEKGRKSVESEKQEVYQLDGRSDDESEDPAYAARRGVFEEVEEVPKVVEEKKKQESTKSSAPAPSHNLTLAGEKTTFVSDVSHSVYGVGVRPNSIVSADGRETVVFQLPPDRVGAIIGARGAVINEIQNRSGAKAQVHQDFPPGVPREVHLMGTPHTIHAAVNWIRRILEFGSGVIMVEAGGDSRQTTSVIKISPSQVSKIIGPGGCNIRELQNRSGARIQVKQNFPPDQPREVHMVGISSAVSKAEMLIAELLNSDKHSLSGNRASGSTRDSKKSIDVPRTMVGRIIGRGGETISMIQKKAGCHMQLDQSDINACCVMLNGSPDRVEIGTQLIEQILNGMPVSKIAALPNFEPGKEIPKTVSESDISTQELQSAYTGMPYGYMYPHFPVPTGYGLAPGGTPSVLQRFVFPTLPTAPTGSTSSGFQQYIFPGQPFPFPAFPFVVPPGFPGFNVTPETTTDTQSSKSSKSEPEVRRGKNGWSEHKNTDGVLYWFHEKTGTSQWVKPDNA